MQQSETQLRRACPSCGARITLTQSRLRRKVQCPKCLNIIPPSVQTGLVQPRPAESDIVDALRLRIRELEADLARGGGEATAAKAQVPVDASLEVLRSENADLTRDLEGAKAALKDAARMVLRIADIEERLTAMGAKYLEAVSRMDDLRRENRNLRQRPDAS